MNIIEKIYTTNGSMDIRKSTTRIILHHAASATASADDIDRWHKEKGYSKIGYHFLVRKDGSIYRGREENMVGAHAYGANYDSIGICAEGDFEVETMSDVQKQSLKELVSYIKNKYNITKVQEHSDVNNTACAGKNYPFDEIANANLDIRNDDTNKSGLISNIQSTINSRYGYNISVDNIYGNDTHKHMVMALQTEFNKQFNSKLSVDGIFGSKTKNACPVLENNDSGNITWLVQSMLVIKGYDLSIDGIYGPNTISAIKDFQSKNNLTSDGITGKNTFEKLFK